MIGSAKEREKAMITKASKKDYRRIINAINRGEKVCFISLNQVKEDLYNGVLYVLKDEKTEKILAIFSIVYDYDFSHYYLKRLKVLNKKNMGKGIANKIIEYVFNQEERIAVTP